MPDTIASLRSADGAPSTLLTALLYFASSLSLLITDDRGGVAVFCCADAVLLSALLLRPAAGWWRPVVGCMAAVLAANLVTGRPPVASLAFAIGNMTTPVLAAWALRRLAGEAAAARTDTPQSIVRFVAVAGVFAPAMGAIVGAGILAIAFGTPAFPAWIAWYATESAGVMLGTPLLLMLWRDELWSWLARADRRRLAAAVILAVAVTVASLLAFRRGFAPLLFVPAILVIVSAFCVGRVGAAVSVLLVALVGSGIADQAGGQLLLVSGDRHVQILFLQSYLAVVLLTALPVAASLEESERLQAALAESESRYRAMAEHSGDLIVWIDPRGAIRYVSPAVRDILGISPEEAMTLRIEDIVHPDDAAVVIEHQRRALDAIGTARTLVYRSKHRDGRVIWMEAKTRAVPSEGARLLGVQWTIRDVTGHKSVEATLAEAANSDPLTGLANRRAFFSLLEIAMTRARGLDAPLCLAIIDLDHFKRINDGWGHDVGDVTLRLMADACQRAVRSDDLFARLGGEEFALLMPETTLTDAVQICERLRATVAGLPIPVPGGDPIRITLSTGITRFAAQDDATALVRAADRALYAAKHEGRNRVQVAARDVGLTAHDG